jgi:predicted nucleic acid-binding protein
MPAIFVDANVPIYAAGRPHPLKAPCAEILVLIAQKPEEFVTDAEILQELLHRYLALNIWPQGQAVIGDFATLMRDRIEPVSAADVLDATARAQHLQGLSARDLLHLAIMARLNVRRIVSADGGFDDARGVERLDPADLDRWQTTIP